MLKESTYCKNGVTGITTPSSNMAIKIGFGASQSIRSEYAERLNELFSIPGGAGEVAVNSIVLSHITGNFRYDGIALFVAKQSRITLSV